MRDPSFVWTSKFIMFFPAYKLLILLIYLFSFLSLFLDPSAALLHHLGQQLKQVTNVNLFDAKALESIKSTSLYVSSWPFLFLAIHFVRGTLIYHRFLLYLSQTQVYYCCNSLLQNASTRSLFSVGNRILDDNIERNNGNVPHVWQ